MKYMDFDTGVTFTEEELRNIYEMFADDLDPKYADFDEYMEDMLFKGRQRVGGLVEVKGGIA